MINKNEYPSNLTKEVVDKYEEYIKKKEERTNNLLKIYSNASDKEEKDALAEQYEDVAKVYNYRDDYIAVITGPGGDKIPIFDKERQAADLRVLEECKKLGERITQEFKPGDKYSKAEIKEKLQDMYDNINYPGTAKATDLGKWLNTKSVQWRDKNGKLIRGFMITN